MTYLPQGNLNDAHENTFDAIVNGTVYSWDNPEIDVSTLADGGVVVLFHDTNTK